MSRFGILYCAHNTEDLVPASLRPWITARKERLLGHEFIICAVSCPFIGFQSEPDDLTKTMLETSHFCKEIDHVILGSEPVKETDARGMALRYLVDAGCDILWQWDSDEVTDVDEIARVIQFVEARPHVAAFRGSLKNLVFTPSQYLVEPFNPMRIHRVRVNGYRTHSFWDDNNVSYRDTITQYLIRDIDFPCATIPKSVQFTPHYTWLNSLRSKKKLEYQQSRGWKCSFAWDPSRGGLIFNPAMPRPEIARDGDAL